MTRSRELPLDARLWDVTTAPTLIAATEALSPECANNLGRRGVEVLILDELTPKAVMQLLYDRGMMSVLWECGGTLAASAIRGGCVQKIVAAIAPKIVGGSNSPSPVGDLGISAISSALVLQDIAWETIGSDLLISGYLKTLD
jgi:diaminohydroxyphosphoribosylaminopyrimidine deaminase/5-amino-6-(5-phosphoribosylamino)uracil reductase